VLTSMQESDLETIGVQTDIKSQVKALASLAEKSGLDGVVCSAHEAAFLREQHKPGFLKVTPGIRLAGDDASDQRRVMTPQKAIDSGADYLVIGRSVTGSANPQATLTTIREGLSNV